MKLSRFLSPGLFILSPLFLGFAEAATFENLTYTTDGTSVTITSCSGTPTSITIPSEIEGLPVNAITGLGSPSGPVGPRTTVTSITIPEGVTTIGLQVFRNFTALRSITLPNSVTTLGAQTFWGCSALTTANLPDGITTLDRTFLSCSALTTVDLPNGLTTLLSTFAGCTSLTSIDLPESVTSIQSAFGGCTSLTSLTLPDGLTQIGDSAFSGCSSLSGVILPAGLTQLGSLAFSGCTSLTGMPFPAGLVSIGNNAFAGCTGLTALTFPAALATIGSAAFENCTGLTGLVVPETVTQIGDNAFWGCQNLTSLNLPDRFLASLANIGLDYNAQLATDALITGIANNLANNPAFVTKLANEIISKTGHYGLSTQSDITELAGMTPQTVRTVLAEIAAEQPPANAITSELASLSVKKGKPVQYAVTTNFNATAFSAVGLPAGMEIHPTTGVVSGKSSKVGTYSVFLYAGVPAGSVVSSAKVFVVTP